jgi:hypothetical protein
MAQMCGLACREGGRNRVCEIVSTVLVHEALHTYPTRNRGVIIERGDSKLTKPSRLSQEYLRPAVGWYARLLEQHTVEECRPRWGLADAIEAGAMDAYMCMCMQQSNRETKPATTADAVPHLGGCTRDRPPLDQWRPYR